MSNRTLGKVDIEAGGSTWSLRMSINALCKLEDELGAGAADINKLLADSSSLGTLRTLFWVALQAHHPGVSKEAAGDLMDEMGLEQVSAALTQAVLAAFGPKVAAGPLAGAPAAGKAATG